MCVSIYMDVCKCMNGRLCCFYGCMYAYVCVYRYVIIYVGICIYTYTHTYVRAALRPTAGELKSCHFIIIKKLCISRPGFKP